VSGEGRTPEEGWKPVRYVPASWEAWQGSEGQEGPQQVDDRWIAAQPCRNGTARLATTCCTASTALAAGPGAEPSRLPLCTAAAFRSCQRTTDSLAANVQQANHHPVATPSPDIAPHWHGLQRAHEAAAPRHQAGLVSEGLEPAGGLAPRSMRQHVSYGTWCYGMFC
jgi:hypothetical protein